MMSVLFAVIVVVVLVRAHAPQEGLVSWSREALAAWRGDKVKLSDFAEPVDGQDLRVADILRMGEQGPAYHEPVDLRLVVDRVRAAR